MNLKPSSFHSSLVTHCLHHDSGHSRYHKSSQHAEQLDTIGAGSTIDDCQEQTLAHGSRGFWALIGDKGASWI
jgi:hypothetical protein